MLVLFSRVIGETSQHCFPLVWECSLVQVTAVPPCGMWWVVKIMWVLEVRIVEDEALSGFQLAAGAADVTLARLLHGLEIGLAATDRVEADGISTSTVTVYDRSGTLGTAVV